MLRRSYYFPSLFTATSPEFQLANIFNTVTAGSILESLGEILEHPSNILAILGKSLPNVVGYFGEYLYVVQP